MTARHLNSFDPVSYEAGSIDNFMGFTALCLTISSTASSRWPSGRLSMGECTNRDWFVEVQSNLLEDLRKNLIQKGVGH